MNIAVPDSSYRKERLDALVVVKSRYCALVRSSVDITILFIMYLYCSEGTHVMHGKYHTEWTNPLSILGTVIIVIAIIAFILAFQHPLCLDQAGQVGGSCGPNVNYWGPGLLALIAGIGLVVIGKRLAEPTS